MCPGKQSCPQLRSGGFDEGRGKDARLFGARNGGARVCCPQSEGQAATGLLGARPPLAGPAWTLDLSHRPLLHFLSPDCLSLSPPQFPCFSHREPALFLSSLLATRTEGRRLKWEAPGGQPPLPLPGGVGGVVESWSRWELWRCSGPASAPASEGSPYTAP